MPELPDVEEFKNVLAGHAAGRRIQRVDVADAGVLRGVSTRQFDESLRGRRFATPQRHGKWLIARTDGPTVLLHFGMTGNLSWSPDSRGRERDTRVVFVTAGGELRYRDLRKLQGIRLAHGQAAERRILGQLGPDALETGQEEFGSLLGSRRAAIKPVLTDQEAIAGLGNLLADEILWRARVHPRTPACALSAEQRQRLHQQMRRVLRASVRAGRVPPRRGWLTGVRDREGAPCPRCGSPLSRGRTGGRGTVWCPACQPQPGPASR